MTHKEFLKNVGMEIKVARIRKGLSVPELCDITKLSKSCIWNIENGNTDTKILSYKRIADALQIEVKNFL